MGVSARAAISDLQLRIYMLAEGAEYESLTLVPMPFSELPGALRRGDISAASAPDPFAAQLVQEGLGRIIDRGSLSRALPEGERVMIAGLAAARTWVESEPQSAHCVLTAVERAIDDLHAEPHSMPPNQHVPYFDRQLEPSDLQRVFDLAYDYRLIDRRVQAPDLILTPA